MDAEECLHFPCPALMQVDEDRVKSETEREVKEPRQSPRPGQPKGGRGFGERLQLWVFGERVHWTYACGPSRLVHGANRGTSESEARWYPQRVRAILLACGVSDRRPLRDHATTARVTVTPVAPRCREDLVAPKWRRGRNARFARSRRKKSEALISSLRMLTSTPDGD